MVAERNMGSLKVYSDAKVDIIKVNCPKIHVNEDRVITHEV